MNKLTKALALIILLVPAIAIFAQETTLEVRNGTVVATSADQLVVKMTDGTYELIAIPPGFMFNVNGQNVPLSDLKPGTELTAEITTKTTPIVVRTTQVRNAEVLKVAGGNLWVKNSEGKIKTYNIPDDFRFVNVEGKEIALSDLRPGDRLTAEIVYKTEHTETAREVKVSGIAPQEPNVPEASAAPEPAAPEALPKTGSSLPLIALLGVLLIATGIAVRRA